jgi:hypothetical protein
MAGGLLDGSKAVARRYQPFNLDSEHHAGFGPAMRRNAIWPSSAHAGKGQPRSNRPRDNALSAGRRVCRSARRRVRRRRLRLELPYPRGVDYFARCSPAICMKCFGRILSDPTTAGWNLRLGFVATRIYNLLRSACGHFRFEWDDDNIFHM